MRRLKHLLAALCLWPALAPAQSLLNPPIYGTGVINVQGGAIVNTTVVNSRDPPANLNVFAQGNITTWNITLPNPPFDGQLIGIGCPGGAVNAINITAPFTIIPGGLVSCPLDSGVAVYYQYSLVTNAWIPIFNTSTGAGGGGTVISGPAGALPYYASAGTTLTPTAVATGVLTAIGTTAGTPGSLVLNGGALGTPSSGNGANITNLQASNLSGVVAVANGGTGATNLAVGKPLLGNGTSPLTNGLISGNTTTFLTADGALTSGHCPQIDNAGGLIDSGGACSTSAGTEYQSTVLSINLVPGVDCTGATDSSAALNTIFSTISGKHIRLINTTNQPCHLVTYQQLQILNATDFWLDGDSETYGTGMTISGCGTPTNTLNGSNAVLYINASFHWRMSGLLIEANGGPRCSIASTFTVSLQRDNTPGTYTDTDSIIDTSTFTSAVNNAYHVTNYIGILESATNGNGENLRIWNSNVLCQAGSNSVAIEFEGAFSDLGDINHNVLSYCYIGVFDLGGSQLRVTNNQTEALGSYSTYGVGGGMFKFGYCTYGFNVVTITGNETDNSGPLLTNDGDTAGCYGGTLRVESNFIGATQLPPNTPAINVGNAPGTFIITGNILANSNLPTFPMIGSFYSSPIQGTLIAYGNVRQGDHGPIYFTGTLYSSSLGSGPYVPIPNANGFENSSSDIWNANDYRLLPGLPASNIQGRSSAIGFESQYNYTPNDYWVYNYVPNQTTTYPMTLVFDAESSGTTPAAGAIATAGPFTGTLDLVATASAPNITSTSVNPQGTTGSTTWSYKLVGVGSNQCTTAASTAITTTSGNATLNTTNYNYIPVYANDYGLIGYKLYRTTSGGTPSTTGYIGWLPIINSTTQTRPVNNGNSVGGVPGEIIPFNDFGVAGDSTTPPTVSTCTGTIAAASLTSGGTQCLQANSAGVVSGTGSGCGGGGGSTVFPQTVSGTTNPGGVPYFSNSTTLTSSAALAANSVVIGGGAGAAPSTTTTGAGVLTAFGNAANATGGIATWPVPVSTGVGGLGAGTAAALAIAPNTIGGLATYPTAAATNNFWVNPVASYNVSGLNTSSFGYITSGTNSLTLSYIPSYQPQNFVNGMGIAVVGAGSAGGTLLTTVTSGGGTNSLTLAANASTTVSSATPGAIYMPGTMGTASHTLTLASTAGWIVGEGIDVAGASSSGADLITTVSAITSGTVLTLTGASVGPVTNAKVNHDDTAGINAALATGANVQLPAGQYNVTSPITWTAASWFQGAGNNQSLIINRGKTNNVIVPPNQAIFAGFMVQQAWDIAPTAGYGLYMVGMNGGQIENNWFFNTYQLIYVGAGDQSIHIDNNSFTNSFQAPNYTVGTTSVPFITLDDPEPDGDMFWRNNGIIDLTTAQQATCVVDISSDSTFWVGNQMGCGLYFVTTSANGENQYIVGNTFEGVGLTSGAMFQLVNAQNWIFTGNEFAFDNGQGAILATGTANKINVTGNNFPNVSGQPFSCPSCTIDQYVGNVDSVGEPTQVQTGLVTGYGIFTSGAFVTATTIGALPACSSNTGLLLSVSNGVASPTYHQTVSTTGSTNQPVYCNGTNWIYD